jgi:predicted hotdog family 3-hydroxylacyl-ACP dehydratase
MLLEKSEVLNMIPQKPPMAVVDGLIAHDDSTTTSSLALNKQNIFCKNGFFHEPGLIENIAQTVALRAGYIANKNNLDPQLGFIGTVKRMHIFELPYDTDILHTKITVLNQLMNASIIKGEVYVGSKIMAKGEMTIFKQDRNK